MGLLTEGRIIEEGVEHTWSWPHSGFSVDQSVPLEAGDAEGTHGRLEYFQRCPFSQARMIEVTPQGKVLDKREGNWLGRFPEPGDEELLAGAKRNFQVFDPLDFLAACPAVASKRRRKVTQQPSSPGRATPRRAFPIPVNI